MKVDRFIDGDRGSFVDRGGDCSHSIDHGVLSGQDHGIMVRGSEIEWDSNQ